ncbi:MAG: creatininase family protein [Myxococcota bacterium]
MPANNDTAASGRALIASRAAEAAAAVAAVPAIFPELLDRPAALPRSLVATGIGTSEGHARHLAEVASRLTDQPARFASTGSLRAGAPQGSEEDWLVVFSQGLSANARYALQDVESWGGVILVTGLSLTATVEEGLSAEKRAWLEDLEARGVVFVEMGCGCEYGALIRVIGARVGYAIGWSLLRTLAARQLKEDALGALLEDEDSGIRLDALQEEASAGASHAVFQNGTGLPASNGDFATDLAAFFAPDRSLVLVSEGGETSFGEHLSLKISEGMLRPQPRCVDVLEFAHGPVQSLAGRPASFIYLLPAPAKGVSELESEAWLARFRATLDPKWHSVCVLRAKAPAPFSILEFEAIFDAWIVMVLECTGGDIVAWPGQEREVSLYAQGPSLASVAAESPPQPRADRAGEAPSRWVLEEAVSPEVEAWVAAGRRTALIALGSVEQHGPHLPLGTDRWIADALAEGLASRLPDAVALPAIPLGCASEHLDFAGTLHVEPETLEAVLMDQLRSLRAHGFERAFLFTAHGGNLDALEAMRTRLVAAAAPLTLRIETDLRVGLMQSEVVEAESLPGRSAGPHAGEYETSLVAWLRPGSIRRDGLVPGRLVEPGEGQGLFYPSLRPNAESGVLGDPSAARASRGERYLSAWLDLLEEAYRAAFSVEALAAEKNRQ